jgi:hypothetical protein
MAFKINGVEISETSRVNGVLWVTGKKLNGKQLNICYYYDLANNNPPFPPTPPIQFSYDDCNGDPQTIDIGAGSPPQQVCALVGTVSVPGGGSSNQGSRCP